MTGFPLELRDLLHVFDRHISEEEELDLIPSEVGYDPDDDVYPSDEDYWELGADDGPETW